MSVYGVDEDGPMVQMHLDNSVLPMSWDVAMRMGARLRVEVRNALEYVSEDRMLDVTANGNEGSIRDAIRVHDQIFEHQYKVETEGPLVVLLVNNNVRLRMPVETAANLSVWLCTSGEKVRAIYAPDMLLRFSVAQLRDGNVHDLIVERRRDATAAFKS